jgi:hypothetical protein
MTDAEKIMCLVDGMPAPMRALVHDYGFTIVHGMICDGYRNPEELRGLLETWRERRQDEWLQTDYMRLDRGTVALLMGNPGT